MKASTKEALGWIIKILRKHKIKFQITGGLAAIIYSSPRKLYDIDIELPEDDLSKILPDVEKYLIEGPEEYIDKSFDMKLLTLRYKGQLIDIAVMNGEKEFDKEKKKWTQLQVNFHPATKRAFGLNLPVIPKEDLIAYKKRIGRVEDKEDLKYL